jgi:drug/metabolite transporter (DMT)-like permease
LLEIALVNYLWPALTVLGSVLLLKRRAGPWLVPGTVLALTGVFLVLAPDGEVSWAQLRRHLGTNPVAFGLVLSAAVAWGLYSNLARLWTVSGSRGGVELFVPVTGVVLLAMRLGVSEPGDWNPRAVTEAAALAAVTTVSYVLWDFSMRRGNLVLVVACSYLTPLLSTLVSCLYLGVSPGLMLWIGCALLVSGSVLTWRSVSEATLRDGSQEAK